MTEHRRLSTASAAMKNWLAAALTVVTLGAPVDIYAAPVAPVPDNPRQAQTSLGFNIKARCPELRIADAGTKAVVVFWVPARGEQSRISLKTSSGLEDLDSAAVACVSKLRFAPATTLGDGDSVDSWQQIALSWADPVKTYESTHSATTPAVKLPANARPDKSGGEGNSVTVHVCVDDKGKIAQEPVIVHSSGVPALDQAAVKIAAAGSAYYRPQSPSTAPPTSGCVRMAIEFGTN
jgi:TonB family protein